MVIENSSVNLIHSGIDLNRIASSSVRGFNGDKTDNIKTQVSRERPNLFSLFRLEFVRKIKHRHIYKRKT